MPEKALSDQCGEGVGGRKCCRTIWISKLSKRETNAQSRVSWVWNRGRGQDRQNGSSWDLTAGFSLLLLPPASLFERQVDDGTISHVVVSQRVGILDENALENRWSASAQGNLALNSESSLRSPDTLNLANTRA